MNFRLIVDIALAAAAEAKMVQAIQTYREATDAVKTAAADLASKWEGDAKEEFVQKQDEAYKFYVGISQVALGACEVVKKMLNNFEVDEQDIINIVSN